MKCYISVVCVLSAFVAVSLAAPATLEDTGIVSVHNQVKRQAADNSEVLNRVISYSNQKLQQLRMLCPQLFQVLDAVIQNVTSQVFRVVGGALLRTGGLGGGGSSGGSSGGGGGGRVSVVLPTFPPDEDDDDDDDDEEADSEVDLRSRTGESSNGTSTSTSTSSSAIALSASMFTSTDSNEIGGDDRMRASSSSSTTMTTVTTTTESESTTITTTTAPFTSPSLTQDSVAKRHLRIARDVDDQETSASGGNGPDPSSDLSNVDADDADRNKRFLPFGGDVHAAGGSGNFLFDLIRLVSGSGATEESDEKSVGGVAEVDIAPKSTEGIPGPITRLLVIANRGIANLIQDLILRLAQTSERIVNFKARLVTALI